MGGVCLYIMLTGKRPFDLGDGNFSEDFENWDWEAQEEWQQLSVEAQGIVKHLLEVDPLQRARIDDCRDDPWVAANDPTAPPVRMEADTRQLKKLGSAVKPTDDVGCCE